MLDITIIILFSIAAILFILSFFRKDRTAELEKQIENLSITYMQEIYLLKKKVRLLEDELLINHQPEAIFNQTKSNSQRQLVQEVISYYEHGNNTTDIANKTGLTNTEVGRILAPYLNAGPEVKRP